MEVLRQMSHKCITVGVQRWVGSGIEEMVSRGILGISHNLSIALQPDINLHTSTQPDPRNNSTLPFSSPPSRIASSQLHPPPKRSHRKIRANIPPAFKSKLSDFGQKHTRSETYTLIHTLTHTLTHTTQILLYPTITHLLNQAFRYH